MASKVLDLGMFSSSGSCQHGHTTYRSCRSSSSLWEFTATRLCSSGSERHVLPHRHRSYAALRLPNTLPPRLRFPSPSAYLEEDGFFFAGVRVHLQNTGFPRSFCCGAPLAARPRGDVGVSQVTGPSSSCAPRPDTPPGPPFPRPLTGSGAAAFGTDDTLGTRKTLHFGADSRGSHARVPTHLPVGCPRGSKAHYWSAGLSSNQVGFAPTGRLTKFPEVSSPPFQWTSIAWSHPSAATPHLVERRRPFELFLDLACPPPLLVMTSCGG